MTDPYCRILGFLDRSRYFFFQSAPQLYSRDRVDSVPDPPRLRKFGSAGNRTRNLWISSQKLWALDHRGCQRSNTPEIKTEHWYLKDTMLFAMFQIIAFNKFLITELYYEYPVKRCSSSIVLIIFSQSNLTMGHDPTAQYFPLKFAVTILPRPPLLMSAGVDAFKWWIELQLYMKFIHFTSDNCYGICSMLYIRQNIVSMCIKFRKHEQTSMFCLSIIYFDLNFVTVSRIWRVLKTVKFHAF
jgi:hypothetical protein